MMQTLNRTNHSNQHKQLAWVNRICASLNWGSSVNRRLNHSFNSVYIISVIVCIDSQTKNTLYNKVVEADHIRFEIEKSSCKVEQSQNRVEQSQNRV